MKVAGVRAFVVRESRGAVGRLVFFGACVAVGVAAVVGVAGLAGALDQGLRGQSRELLAADLSVDARTPLPLDEIEAAIRAARPDARMTTVRELASMAGAIGPDGTAERSRLCELKVVGGEYPYYGDLVLDTGDAEPRPPSDASDRRTEASPRLSDVLDANTAVVAPELCAGLGLDVGDELLVGGARFRIAAVVLDEPDKLDFALTLGPRLFLSRDGFDRTSLLGVGNRVKYRALFALEGNPTREELEELEEDIEERFADTDGRVRARTHFDSQQGVRRGLDRFESFLGLVALLSLVLGGIGVAQVVRSWLASRVIGIAVWRSIGLLPREILTLYLVHALVFAFVGSLVGAAIGGSVPLILPRLAPDLLPSDMIDAWQPLAILRGLLLGVGVAGLSALPALTAVWRVPPALVLRSGAEPLPAPRAVRWGAFGVVALGLFASAWIQADRLTWAASFTGGLALLGLLLFAGARGLVRIAGAVPRKGLGPYVAHGLAALARPGAGTVGAIVALGLGTLVVGTMVLVENRMSRELREALPDDAPSVFLVDVQKDQWDGIEGVLEDAHASRIDSVPVVMARLAAIDGESVEDIVANRDEDERDRSRWTLTREQRLTYMDELPRSNTLSAGALWEDDAPNELSLDENFAEDLGATLGTRLTFNVQGVPFDFVVTSLRTIDWSSFDINFFLIAEPGVLEDAPQMRLAAARVEEAEEQGVQDRLVSDYPNVTMLRLRPIIEKVGALLTRIAFGVRMLGSFTILAGLAILAGSVGATQLLRGREVALFKTLGVTRRGVFLVLATEFALSGIVAGALGGIGAYTLAWSFLEYAVEIEAELPALAVPLAVLGTALLAALAGIAASGRALAVRPIETLR